MVGINNLEQLIKSMRPQLVLGEFVFCTIKKEDYPQLKIDSKMIFKEKEGFTIIVTKKEADKLKLNYGNIYSLITLTVHSDLNAVGFLAKVTKNLAKAGISVNAVSAYYHDHLFIPKERTKEALEILKELSK